MQTTEQIIERLKEDYARFPKEQSYELYAKDVQFKDPLNSFSGVEKYKKMIAFLSQFFRDIDMELHSIEQIEQIEQTGVTSILTRWMLNMTAPAPWAPRLSISGRSELGLDSQQLINSHIDYWNCSRLDVLKQVFKFAA
ncbi:MAG: DUF2358 domain-containing protein [Cyanobacteria bacterium J06631_9]